MLRALELIRFGRVYRAWVSSLFLMQLFYFFILMLRDTQVQHGKKIIHTRCGLCRAFGSTGFVRQNLNPFGLLFFHFYV